MNKYALYHKSESEYCYPIDNKKALIRFRCQRDDADIKEIYVIYNMCAYFPRSRKRMKMMLKRSDELFSYFEAILNCEIPSYMYLFKIVKSDGSIGYYDELGWHDTIDIKNAGVTAFRLPFINDANVIKENSKFKGDVIYQIFPERFLMGNENKDKSYITQPWDSVALKGKNFQHNVFLGGDLQGIIAKLDYLKDLGVDVIYMTPINQSSSNHKYNIDDYYKIDEHFGDDKTFKLLVQLAHQKGLKVMMDLVFNHSAHTHPFYKDVLEHGKESKYYDFYCMQDKKLKTDGLPNYTFNSCQYMPKLNTNNKVVQDYFADVGVYYLTKFDVDGFRLDVANEVCHPFWINFNKKVKAIKPDCLIIGENWDNAHEYLKNYEFDGIMNYTFWSICWDYFLWNKTTSRQFVDYLNWLLTRYPDNANRMSFNLLDSHDTARFYNFCDGNKDLCLLGFVTMIAYVGLPMIYYGDEIFMMGSWDPDNRRGMEWNSKEFDSRYHEIFKSIIKLRKYEEFTSGDISIKEDQGVVIISRYINKKIMSVYINKTNKNYIVNGNKIILSNKYEKNTLKPFGFVVFKN